MPKISQGTIEELGLPIPPSSEQQRIVEAIESYFTRLDDAVATLERVERNLKRYRASVLKSAVEGRLVPTEAALARQEGRDYEPASVLLERILNERRRRWVESGKKGKYQDPEPPDTTNLPELPEGWCWATVDQLAAVGTGATPKRGNDRFWTNGTIPWVTSSVVNERRVAAASDLVTDAALAETNLTLYRPGTLLVAMYGEGKTRGMISELAIEAATNQALAAIVLEGSAGLEHERRN
jgi:type I restriction enzyme S subunit